LENYLLTFIIDENTILVPTFWGHDQFGPYNSQFSSCYFQLTVNLVPTINSLTENAYIANGLHSWHV